MQSITEIQQLDKMKTPLSLIDHTGGGMKKQLFIMWKLCRNVI